MGLIKAKRLVLAATIAGMWVVLGGVVPAQNPAPGSRAEAGGKLDELIKSNRSTPVSGTEPAAAPAKGGGCFGRSSTPAVVEAAPKVSAEVERLREEGEAMKAKNAEEAAATATETAARHTAEEKDREWAKKFDDKQAGDAKKARRKQADYLFTQSSKNNRDKTAAQAIARELARKNPGLKAEFEEIALEWQGWEVVRPPPARPTTK